MLGYPRFLVRRETGKESVVKVDRDEGVASHRRPRAMRGGSREGVGDALTGEYAGQSLSRERVNFGCRRGQKRRKAMRRSEPCERLVDRAWSKTLACMDAPCAGAGRSPARPLGWPGGPRWEGEEP